MSRGLWPQSLLVQTAFIILMSRNSYLVNGVGSSAACTASARGVGEVELICAGMGALSVRVRGVVCVNE